MELLKVLFEMGTDGCPGRRRDSTAARNGLPQAWLGLRALWDS